MSTFPFYYSTGKDVNLNEQKWKHCKIYTYPKISLQIPNPLLYPERTISHRYHSVIF